MKNLIINADDFGLCKGVTDGIYNAIKNGVVSSTTMMVNTPTAEYAAELIKKDENLAVGLHINITLGAPLTSCPSLVQNGLFIKPKNLENCTIYSDEDLQREMNAQYERFVTLTGKTPTHIDSHLYAHQLFQNVRTQLLALAQRNGIPARGYATVQHTATVFEGDFKVLPSETKDDLSQKLYTLVNKHLNNAQTVELMVHPGFADEWLLQHSAYNTQRETEHAVLTSIETASFLQAHGIKIISF